MTDNITQNTNFSNVTITNDYPCLVGGTWTASLDSNNNTVYTNGDQTYNGPVNLIGGTLTITEGAVVSDLTAINNPTINVDSGGTLENSDIFNANVTINTNGTSNNNNYVSSNMTINNQAESTSDNFYYPGKTSETSGTLISEFDGGNSYSFQTSNDLKSFSIGNNITFNDPRFPDISANNPNSSSSSNQTISLGYGSNFGDTKLAPTTDYSNNQFRLTNDYETYVGGDWTASLNSDNKTVYSNGSITVEGPINLVSIDSLTINEGAIVDGITITGNSSISEIANSGTIQNSFIANGTIRNNGLSKGNTYISEAYTGNSGSTTSGDVFYSSLGSSGNNYGYYNFSNMPDNGSKTFILDDGYGMIQLFGGSKWENSYAGTDGSQSNSKINIYRYNTSDVACFLAGTMIKTAKGYIAIEDLQIGDEIIVFNGQSEEVRPIVWKGYNNVYTNNDKEKSPVRILKDAIAKNLPCRDLLITPEHCLFFENRFIPVYMLVNGTTIFYDQSIKQYTYYHIETEPHSVIIAEGMLTESYLDTGNRHTYHQSEKVISIHNKNKSWNIDSAAPLETKREIVEPIFNQITQRIPELGLTYTSEKALTTDNNGLYLKTDKGEILYKTNDKKDKLIFRIPSDTNYVRLISKTSKPSEIIGPFVGDRRNLGVLVGNIVLMEPHNHTYINKHLTSHQTKGWDPEMPTNCRWTNGDAYLELPITHNDCNKILVIEILDGGPYPLDSDCYENSQSEYKVS